MGDDEAPGQAQRAKEPVNGAGSSLILVEHYDRAVHPDGPVACLR